MRVLNSDVDSRCIVYSPDGRRIAASDRGKVVRLWDSISGREVATMKGQSGTIRSLAFSADGKRLAAAANDPRFHIWDTVTGQEVFALAGPYNYQAVAFSPDGRTIALAESFGFVVRWRIPTDAEVRASRKLPQ